MAGCAHGSTALHVPLEGAPYQARQNPPAILIGDGPIGAYPMCLPRLAR